jgi:acyl-CoA synthetase (AMP-forming)/AMP-acid ligase II
VTPIDKATGVWELLEARAGATPESLLAQDEFGRSFTVGELFERVLQVAAGLWNEGIRPGDVISWQLTNRVETIVFSLALSRLGVVQNPLVAMLREPEIEFITRQAGSKRLYVPRVFRGFDHEAMAVSIAGRVPGLSVRVADDGWPTGDPAVLPAAPVAGAEVRWLAYTSGTTAAPKGARHRDSNLLAAAENFGTGAAVTSDDRVALLAPIGHVGGLAHVFTALRRGSSVILSEVFDPERTSALLADDGVTIVGSGVPFIRAYLQQQALHPERRLFPAARAFLCGGSPHPAALHEQVKRELGGIGIISGYGLTECPHITWGHIDDSDHEHATTEGRPGKGGTVHIVLPDGRLAAAGEVGEIRVRGPQLMLGYVDSSLDAEAFDEDGFLRTGDLGFLDERGYLTITGRLKDIIIRNMENISAREVEEKLIEHPAVADVAVIGLPSAKTGELACAVVVSAEGVARPTIAELSAFLTEQGLNIRKHPEQLEFIDVLPRNAMNKIIKPALQQRFSGS